MNSRWAPVGDWLRKLVRAKGGGTAPSSNVQDHLAKYSIALGGVIACTGLIALLRLALPGASLAILYLLPVLVVASIAGRGPAVAAAVFSFLIYNFSFVDPVFTLTINDPREWPNLLVFLATALVAGQLAAALRLQAEEAQARARLLADLYALNQALITDRKADELLMLIAEQIVATFRVGECIIQLPDADGQLQVRARAVSGTIPAQTTTGGPGPRDRDQGELGAPSLGKALFIPLLAGTRRVGLMRVVHDEGYAPDEERWRLLHTFAASAALAIERGLLAETAERAATLARSDALKSTLLSSVSHELRSPLAAIKGSVSSLLEDEAVVRWEAAQRRELLLTIDEETDRLTRLVANLLDLSRIEAGVLRPRREPYPLDELLWSTVERLGPAAGRVAIQIPDDLPLVPLDPILMERVVGNLLENALKYSPPGSPIALTARLAGTRAELIVSDHGPGIPERERERIFERFYRAAPSLPVKGLGLGLALSLALVEAHNGRITIEDVAGGGTRFITSLPLVADATPTWSHEDGAEGKT